jgi:hypothetical protein
MVSSEAILEKLDKIELAMHDLKTDVSALKTDVSALKTDVSALKTDLGLVARIAFTTYARSSITYDPMLLGELVHMNDRADEDHAFITSDPIKMPT